MAFPFSKMGQFLKRELSTCIFFSGNPPHKCVYKYFKDWIITLEDWFISLKSITFTCKPMVDNMRFLIPLPPSYTRLLWQLSKGPASSSQICGYKAWLFQYLRRRGKSMLLVDFLKGDNLSDSLFDFLYKKPLWRWGLPRKKLALEGQFFSIRVDTSWQVR